MLKIKTKFQLYNRLFNNNILTPETKVVSRYPTEVVSETHFVYLLLGVQHFAGVADLQTTKCGASTVSLKLKKSLIRW